jgi:hypothetical protein
MTLRKTLTQDELQRRLVYDADTGVFTRRVASGRHGCHRAGEIAGTPNGNGYIRIRLGGKNYYAHILAWLYVHGTYPEVDIDHRDLDKANNRILNLRLSGKPGNMHNRPAHADNRSGAKGVTHRPKRGGWEARIYVNKKERSLGLFSSVELAAKAYEEAALLYHGEYARTK